MFRELLALKLLLLLLLAWIFGCDPLPEALKKKKSEATCSGSTALKLAEMLVVL